MLTIEFDPSVWWVLVLVLGFPIAMLLLGELIFQLQRRQSPLVAPLRILRQLILPSLVLIIVLLEVFGLPRNHVLVRLSETLLWIMLIYAGLTLLNVLLFENVPEDSWQAKVPQLFRDLCRFVLVLMGSAIVLSSVWGADLGSLFTALGVGSVVIGLALQDSLGNIFSGMALLFEQPFSLEDWIEVGDRRGKVVEINWRSVHLQTLDNDLLVVPNSELMKGSFTNFSRPSRIHVENVQIKFSYDDPPNKVKRILQQTALQIDGVLHDPVPQVDILTFEDSHILYQVELFSPSYEGAAALSREFNTRIWYAAKRHRLAIAACSPMEPSEEERQQILNLQVFRQVSGFAGLPPNLLQLILRHSEVQDFAKHEVVLQQGDRLSGLYLILDGQAQLSITDFRTGNQIVGVITAGEFFGEKASLLSDQTTDMTVRVLEDLRVLLIDTDTLHQVLEQSPRLAQELGEVMEIRRRAVQALQSVA